MKLILRISGVVQPAVAGTPDHDLWSLTYDCQDYEVRTDEEKIAAQLWTARSDPRARMKKLLHSSGQHEAIRTRSATVTPTQLGGVVQPVARTDEDSAAQLWKARSDPHAQVHSHSHSARRRFPTCRTDG